ncbi:MAG: hypothetical protein ACYDBQ_03425 [Thermoplasmatota archaeon]
MRAVSLVPLLLVVAALAGCTSSTGTTSSTPATPVVTSHPLPTTNMTAPKPNVPPIVHLKVTANGTPTRVVGVGTRITIDASGSMDPDGFVTGAAVKVIMANQTAANAPSATLYDAQMKMWMPVTFNMSSPGITTLDVTLLDDNAGFTENVSYVYVDPVLAPLTFSFASQAPNTSDPTWCQGFVEHTAPPPPGGVSPTLADANYYSYPSFIMPPGVTSVNALVAGGGAAAIAICNPSAKAISPGGANVTTTSGNLTPSQNYHVAIDSTASAAPPSTHNGGYVRVTLHFEPAGTK